MIHSSPAFWQEAKFRRSSFSGTSGGDCVEIAQVETMFGIRDSKTADGPVLAVGEAKGRVFLAAVKRSR